MITDTSPLVLGSLSPRRREILTTLRIPFVVTVAAINEKTKKAESADDYLERIVRAKLRAVANAPEAEGRAVLVADTIVILEGETLGKPRDVAEAGEMIGRLSGREHQVATRFAISDPVELSASAGPAYEETVMTRVFFRSLSSEEISRYAASEEGLDKAGAYAIQGLGSFAVARIEGSYSNVVGLPACEVVVALKKLGLLGPYPK